MEEAFNKIKGQKKNSVKNLMQWMRDAKIVKEETTEDKLRNMFSDAKDQADVDLASFKSALQKLSKEQKTPFEEFTDKLGREVPRFMEAAGAALSSGAAAASEAASAAAEALKNATK